MHDWTECTNGKKGWMERMYEWNECMNQLTYMRINGLWINDE